MSEESLYVSNNIIHFFVTLSGLIDCKHPRGIFVKYERAMECINILKNNQFPDSFEQILLNFVNQQYKYRQPYNSYILEKLKEEPSINTLEREAKYFLNKNIPDYISEEENYINNQINNTALMIRKISIIENAISRSTECLPFCDEKNFKLINVFIASLNQRKTEIERA